jgi:hypothetical protein
MRVGGDREAGDENIFVEVVDLVILARRKGVGRQCRSQNSDLRSQISDQYCPNVSRTESVVCKK